MNDKKDEKNEKFINLKESYLRESIYQGNPLINARKDMNIVELRIFSLGLRGINPHLSNKDKFYDEEFPIMFIPTSKVAELFGNTWYLHDLEKICDKMFNTTIKLRPKDGGFELFHIFQYLKYIPKEGLYIQFDNHMKPYLLDLINSHGYTKIDIRQVFPLMSAYAWHLIELLIQFQGTKKDKLVRKIDMNDLRFTLNVPENAYVGRMDNFKAKVIDEPIAEINEKTDYKMSYSVIKTGRKVTGFEFYMDISKALNAERLQKALDMRADEVPGYIIENIMRHGIREKDARELWDLCRDTEDCINRLMYAEEELGRQIGSIKNESGFIYTAVKENWYQKNFEKRCKEMAETKSDGIPLIKDAWLKLMYKFNTYNTREIQRRSGMLRMLQLKEIETIRNDLLNGGFSPNTKKMLSNLCWDFGLAVDIFSFNNNTNKNATF